jgi:hypothetical protein
MGSDWYGDQIGGPLVSVDSVHSALVAFVRALPPTQRWDVETSFDWDSAEPGLLTEGERSAVEFITIIEDHLPGYFGLYEKHFPVDDSVDSDTYIHNRELYHFSVRWAQEEDNHARALERYQLETKMTDAETLRRSLAVEGQKRFDPPLADSVAFFTYPLVQEKATQMYYQQLRQVVDDPLLKAVLGRLSRDEARHFTFFADIVAAYLQQYGDSVVDSMRDVIADFRMPLADTIRGYWRWALKIADTARYDHLDAYEHLLKVVDRAVDARTDKVDELFRFVASARALSVGRIDR